MAVRMLVARSERVKAVVAAATEAVAMAVAAAAAGTAAASEVVVVAEGEAGAAVSGEAAGGEVGVAAVAATSEVTWVGAELEGCPAGDWPAERGSWAQVVAVGG